MLPSGKSLWDSDGVFVFQQFLRSFFLSTEITILYVQLQQNEPILILWEIEYNLLLYVKHVYTCWAHFSSRKKRDSKG